MNSEKIYVFVYGSLKQGYGNHRHLGLSGIGSELLAKNIRTVRSDFRMLSYGSFPGVYKKLSFSRTPGKHISGELYEVTPAVLDRLDDLESNGTFYTRELVEIEGFNKLAWMYVLEPRLSQDQKSYAKSKIRIKVLNKDTYFWCQHFRR